MKLNFDIPKHIFYNKFNFVTCPSFCTFILTWRCNLRCSMCSIWKKQIEKEMNLDQIQKIFSKLKFIRYIKITGGEPFLRSDIIELTNIIIKEISPSVLHITTNGYFPERVIEFLEQVSGPFLHLKISIDGTEQIHDRIRGVKGSFSRALKTLEQSSLLSKKINFKLGINYTISENNLDVDELSEIRNLCKKFKANLYIDFAYDSPPLYDRECQKGVLDGYSFFKSNIKKLLPLLDYIKKYISSSVFVENLKQKYYIYGFENRIIYGINKPKPRCVQLNSHFRLMPNGDIVTCLYKPDVIGNLLNSSFKDIWFSLSTQRFRDEVRNCHGCWAGCEIGPNVIFTGDILKAIWY